MNRKEIAHRAYEIFKRDGKAYGDNDTEIWKAIVETDDDQLEDFIYEHE